MRPHIVPEWNWVLHVCSTIFTRKAKKITPVLSSCGSRGEDDEHSLTDSVKGHGGDSVFEVDIRDKTFLTENKVAFTDASGPL